MTAHPIGGGLRVPLTQEQVDAADQLQSKLKGWKLYEGILRDLADRFPSNCDLAHVLPKAITLNALYATGILAIQQMARHITNVAESSSDYSRPEFADEIARLTNLGPQRKTRNCLSFASKYCHFFVDSQRFAILDAYAANALVVHLGKDAVRLGRYADYLNAVDRLIAAAGLRRNYAELDHYLWLAGQRIAYNRGSAEGKPRAINAEVLPLFDHPDAECKALIGKAFGHLP